MKNKTIWTTFHTCFPMKRVLWRSGDLWLVAINHTQCTENSYTERVWDGHLHEYHSLLTQNGKTGMAATIWVSHLGSHTLDTAKLASPMWVTTHTDHAGRLLHAFASRPASAINFTNFRAIGFQLRMLFIRRSKVIHHWDNLCASNRCYEQVSTHFRRIQTVCAQRMERNYLN